LCNLKQVQKAILLTVNYLPCLQLQLPELQQEHLET